MLRPSDRVRNLPLEPILELLGCTRDPKDRRRNWQTPAGRVTVTRQQFYCHALSRGGGGAIDLCMLLMGCTAKEAIERLGGLLADSALKTEYTSHSSEYAQAAFCTSDYNNDDPSAHLAVLSYLTKQRRLPADLIQRLMDKGQIGAHMPMATTGKKIVNCAFFLRSSGQVVGAELRGVVGRFHGVRGRKGTFLVTVGEVGSGPLALTEGAIDALSLHVLRGVAVASTGGDGPKLTVAAAQYWLGRGGGPIYAAQDADGAGERQAQTLVAAVPGVERWCPTRGKDWNEHLRSCF